jgi:hypothetical protein
MKVGDFGMSCIVSNDPPDEYDDQNKFVKNGKDVLELVGSMQYTAPELVNPELQSSKGTSPISTTTRPTSHLTLHPSYIQMS